MRKLNSTDQLISQIDKGLRTLFAMPLKNSNSSPAKNVKENTKLKATDKKRAARLMRVNHAGEIAAQGLYHGHSCVAKNENIREKLNESAREEEAHLRWCESRLGELDDQPSIFAPVWYFGSFAMGAAVGIFGDKWSLGFVSETEKQVIKHLDKHLERLPVEDVKSREILLKMREDEAMHDQKAQAAGAKELPPPVKVVMSAVSKVMTKTSYWI